jgi:hypothetical protein
MVEFQTTFARYRLQWRPEPSAEEMRGQGDWQPCIPDFRVILSSKDDSWHLPVGLSPEQVLVFRDAAAGLRAEIPAELANAVERFRDGQWPMLMLLHECPDALDLARNSPALFYCLANSNEFRRTAPAVAAIQALFRRKQRQRAILEWLGFPATEAMVRLMRKIPHETANAYLLRPFRNMVRESLDITQMLAHVPRLPEGVLSLVIYSALHRFLTPKLLACVADAEDEQTAAPTAAKLEQILTISREVALSQPLKPFESREQVQDFLDKAITERDMEMQRRLLAQQALEAERAQARRRQRAQRRAQRREEDAPLRVPLRMPVELERLMTRYTEKELRLLRKRPFPKPPYPGTETIVPLTSAEALELEGTLQEHCAKYYLLPVLAGLSYLYKVTAPQRATLSLEHSGKRWRMSQLRAHRNAPVSPETLNAVRTWLHQVKLDVPRDVGLGI